ncbi:MAG TPA: LysM peptidoglycan-binding domain-containing protein [Planctomycetota bacterium]|nr:LysM peptidoglycan-binding domain-containing protein [Planctomycetota bacterium]
MLSRVYNVVTVFAAAGVLLFSSGCCNSHKAAKAQTPPPSTLSEPVRVSEAPPVSAPVAEEEPRAIPVSVRENDPVPVSMKTGESIPLPAFREPAPATGPKAAVTFEDPAKSGNYHVLSKGETLSVISRKYNVPLKKIIDANHFKDPNKLPVGTKVYVPK